MNAFLFPARHTQRLATSFVPANERAFTMRVTGAEPESRDSWNFVAVRRNEYIGRGTESSVQRRAFTCSVFSLLQGFQSGKDSRTAKVVRNDVGGTFAQLRLGDQLSELPRSYSRWHVQTALLDEQGGAARHRQSGGSLSKDPQAVRGGQPAVLEETSEEQTVDVAQRGRGHRRTGGPRQRRDERRRTWTIGAQQSVTEQWRPNRRKFLYQIGTVSPDIIGHFGGHRWPRYVQVNTGWSSARRSTDRSISFT